HERSFASAGSSRMRAAAAARILDDPALAKDLSCRGQQRARTFTWRETARRTLDLYREIGS
ncbi:MAG TPA: hypothetical protein VFE84_14985, partial [Patescibacteria group bacterium]|nr:hypothetical protein [Patescibacteria group bacterium]